MGRHVQSAGLKKSIKILHSAKLSFKKYKESPLSRKEVTPNRFKPTGTKGVSIGYHVLNYKRQEYFLYFSSELIVKAIA